MSLKMNVRNSKRLVFTREDMVETIKIKLKRSGNEENAQIFWVHDENRGRGET